MLKNADESPDRVVMISSAEKTDVETGLREDEVVRLREEHGYNETVAETTPAWKKVVKHSITFMNFFIMVAMAASLVPVENVCEPGKSTVNYLTFCLLLIELISVVAVDYVSERNTGDALAVLKSLGTPHCMLLRNGVWSERAVRELVPGDIFALGIGSVVPADAKIVAARAGVQMDESALTGEFVDVVKYQNDELLAGSIMRRGECTCVVLRTGANTSFGRAMALIASVEHVGSLQVLLRKLSLILTAIGFLFCVVGITLALKVRPKTEEALYGFELSFGVIIAYSFGVLVAAVPIAMPLMTGVTLAVGAREIASTKTVVTRLSAIEELAGVEVLCCDKTGTLTLNELELNDPFLPEGSTSRSLAMAAALSANRTTPDAIDTLVLTALRVDGDEALIDSYETISYTPFDPDTKRTEAHVVPTDSSPDDFKSSPMLITKGAPPVIRRLLANSELNSAEEMTAIDQALIRMSENGLRTLMVAINYNPDEPAGKWKLVGIMSFFDPLRPDSVETVARAITLGVDVKMLTGDHLAVAKKTATVLGMKDKFGHVKIFDADFSQQDRDEMVLQVSGFASLSPEHKFKIIESLQRMGKSVAMTGDGINDAPALKRAQVGIAVCGATDAAKAASDLVVLQGGMTPVIKAIEASRRIFVRLRSYFVYKVACTFLIAEWFFIAAAWGKFVLPPWLVVVFNILVNTSVGSVAKDKAGLTPSPISWHLPRLMTVALVLGNLAVVQNTIFLLLSHPEGANWWCSLGVCPPNQYVPFSVKQDLPFLPLFCTSTDIPTNGVKAVTIAQLGSVMYLNLMLTTQMMVFSARTEDPFYKRAPSVPVIVATGITVVLSTLLAQYWSLGASLWVGGVPLLDGVHNWAIIFIIWLWNAVWFLFSDLAKVLLYRKLDALIFGTLDAEETVEANSNSPRPSRSLSRRQSRILSEPKEEPVLRYTPPVHRSFSGSN